MEHRSWSGRAFVMMARMLVVFLSVLVFSASVLEGGRVFFPAVSEPRSLSSLDPAIAEMLAKTFGSADVRITDLNRENIGACKYGVQIWDGHQDGGKLVRESDVVLITGTTVVNGTFDTIMSDVRRYDRDCLIYGVTSAGICQLMNLNRICPYGRDQ